MYTYFTTVYIYAYTRTRRKREEQYYGSSRAAGIEERLPQSKQCKGILDKGTCQPYCRSLPEDPLLECFEFADEFDIQVRQRNSEAVKGAIRDHHVVWAVNITNYSFF
ncbi:hypothetical protein CRYUN_Cryun35bG0062000 [Craigia yunnanensis]